MPDTRFIITIDTEGDNLWARPRTITTRNAAYLPRFQNLCERYGFKPVYLTNFEMAESDVFVEFARDVLARGAGEVGMHLHAWNSPPLEPPLTIDDFHCQPYVTEFPESRMWEKIRRLTQLLEERFDRRMISHRGGRWALDERYAAMLLALGYRVDCSVTPGIDWRGSPGANGGGGPDFRACSSRPYFLSPSDVATPSAHGLLEVPMTVRASRARDSFPWIYQVPLVRRVANRVSPAVSWLCPVQPTLTGGLDMHLDTMLAVARAARIERPPHLEFMLHSSELMPGGSPTFRSDADIERLYEYLERLFEEAATWSRGATLAEFCDEYAAGSGCRAGAAICEGGVFAGAGQQA